MVAHEKLEVYRHALRSAILLDHVSRNIEKSRGDLRDELRRASSSVLLNVAEGADEISPREKAKFYRMARRSCAECHAVLDLITGIIGTAPPRQRNAAGS